MNAKAVAVAGLAAILLAPGAGVADITIDTVPVGNTGNTGEWSGESYFDGDCGPDRICGAVDYDFNIGTYEVTAGQYRAFLNAVAGVDTYDLYNAYMSSTDYGSGIMRSGGGTVGNPYTYSVAPDFTNRPVNYVSWGDAARFANWLHNGQPTGTLTGDPAQDAGLTEDGAYDLDGATSDSALLAISREADWKWAITSEDEWYKAAYYNPATSSYYDYPTTTNTAPGQDMADVSGNNANHYTAPYTYPIDSGKCTTVAGEFQNSDSPYGTFDQGGNVWEWNEAVIGFDRGLRGGSFSDNDYVLHAAFRGSLIPTDRVFFIGFRVSEVPEPCSAALLLIGAIGLVKRRRTA